MTMARAQLATDVRRQLMDSAKAFLADGVDDGSEFDTILDAAAADLSRLRPRTLVGTLTLVADQSEYVAPADILYTKESLWGSSQRRSTKRWDRNYPRALPKLKLISNDLLMLTPSPSASQIATMGTEYKYYYAARHLIGDTTAQTTVPVADRHLLIMRAMIDALRWLAINQINKPVRLRDGISNSPRNGTPAALAEQMMSAFEIQAR